MTLENVPEQIIGAVDDEFDKAEPNIASHGPAEWIVPGTTPIEVVVDRLEISTDVTDVDTFSGLLMHYAQ